MLPSKVLTPPSPVHEAMQATNILRAFPLCLGLLMGCGGNDPSMSFPEDDAAAVDETATIDDAGTPTFDVGSRDSGTTPVFDIPVTDRGSTTTDTGTSTDRGTVTPTDRGTVMACPSACTADVDCDPCRTSSDPSTVRYCCLSGLCISMTGACPTSMTGGGGGDGGAGGGDGGLGADAAGAADAATGTDASGGGAG